MQWILWATGTLASFIVLEVITIRSPRKGDTLSERIRARFRTRTVHGAAAFISLVAGFTVWLVGHIVFGWA